MATVEVEVQNEDNSDKRTIFRYRKLYDMFLFISILLLFINYFTVQRELEELREYLGSGCERGEKVDEGDNWTIGQVGHKIPTIGQTVHEGDKREPDVKPSSLLNSTDTGCASGWSGLIHTGQCYKHIQTNTTCTEARKFCQNLSPSADLASIPDKITNDFLTNLASSKFWTGGFKNVWENGEYAWVNGDKWTGYTAWAEGEPNGEPNRAKKMCIEVHTKSSGSWRPGLWNDATLTNKVGAMCQYKNPRQATNDDDDETTEAPNRGCSLTFEVKGTNDAHILLSPCSDCDGYEIVIGGWNNTRSAIRDGKGKRKGEIGKNTPNILSAEEFRQFWIKITEGDEIMISVGKGGEEDHFMETTFGKKHNILYAAFAAWDNTNEWKVNIPKGQRGKKLSLTTVGYNYQYHPFICSLSDATTENTFPCMSSFKGITYNNAGKISSGSIIEKFDELSPFYTLKTKVKVNKYTSDYAALWHFTTGPNCCVLGSRIPGIFILPKPYNRFQISVAKDNNVDYAYQWNFTLNTWYEIELSQTEEGNNGRIKLVVNGVERRNVRNTAPRSFTGVKVYQGSPNSYTDGVKNPATPDIDYEYFYYENHDPANDGEATNMETKTGSQPVQEGDKREPDVKPSSLLNSTYRDIRSWLQQHKNCGFKFPYLCSIPAS